MEICILTLGDNNIQEYSKYSFSINKSYAEKYGYTYLQYNSTLDKTRPPQWSKIIAIQRQINNFDWIFWIDADAIFFNHDIQIEEILDDSNYFFVSKAVGENWEHNCYLEESNFLNINTGIFIVKGRNPWSYSLLEYWYSKNNRINHKWFENQSFCDIYLENNQYYNSKIKILEQKILNGFEKDFYCYSDFSNDQYIMHYAGMPNNDRLYGLQLRYQEFIDGKFSGEKKNERKSFV